MAAPAEVDSAIATRTATGTAAAIVLEAGASVTGGQGEGADSLVAMTEAVFHVVMTMVGVAGHGVAVGAEREGTRGSSAVMIRPAGEDLVATEMAAEGVGEVVRVGLEVETGIVAGMPLRSGRDPHAALGVA